MGRVLGIVLLLTAAMLAQDAVLQALAAVRGGHPERAVLLLHAHLAQHASDAEAWNLLGVAEGQRGQSAAAAAALRRALTLQPRLQAANENLGLLLYRTGHYREAVGYLGQAVAAGSGVSVRWTWAQAQHRAGQDSEAATTLLGLQTEMHEVAPYWEERGAVALALADLAGAEQAFDHALRLQPTSLAALNGAAQVAERQNNWDKALALLLRARRAAPDDVTTLFHFGHVCLVRDLDDDALAALGRAHELAPGSDPILYDLASAQLALEHYDEAHRLLRSYAAHVPDFPTTYYALGWIDLKLGRPAAARQAFEQCLRLSPHFQDALYEIAQLDLDAGRLDAARAGFQAVLRLNPRHAPALQGLGDLALRSGSLADAEVEYRAAVAARPTSGAAHYKLATVLYRQHRAAEADQERELAKRLTDAATLAGRMRLKLGVTTADSE